MRRVCLLAAISALVPITSGCGGPQERSTTIPPPAPAKRPLSGASAGGGPHADAPQRKPRLVSGELWGRRYTAVSFVHRGDHPGVEPVPHTHFSFSRERFGGRVRESIGWDDGCNGYGGFVRIRGATMHVWNVAGTTVACVSATRGGKPVIEHGPLLMNFFGGQMRWRLHGENLIISRGTQILRLRETQS